MHLWRSEDNLRPRSSPSTLFGTGCLFRCLPGNWPVSFCGFSYFHLSRGALGLQMYATMPSFIWALEIQTQVLRACTASTLLIQPSPIPQLHGILRMDTQRRLKTHVMLFGCWEWGKFRIKCGKRAGVRSQCSPGSMKGKSHFPSPRVEGIISFKPV